jgi:dTDP-glucose 4,6-dehydratase
LVGSRCERTNLQVVKAVCAAFDRLRPTHGPHERLMTRVADRPGHDRRYSIDPTKVERETGWAPRHNFESALEKTVVWYLENQGWWQPIRSGVYKGERLGLSILGR